MIAALRRTSTKGPGLIPGPFGVRRGFTARAVVLLGVLGCAACAGAPPPVSAPHPPRPSGGASASGEAGASGLGVDQLVVDQLVVGARWVDRGGRRSLEVVPGPAQRGSVDEATITAAWQRILGLHPDADVPGMRDQYACHVLFAPDKDAYYLEPWRPAVGAVRTVAEGCNPGERKDLG